MTSTVKLKALFALLCACIGALAAEAMAEAIVRAVRQARSIPGYPAAGDLTR